MSPSPPRKIRAVFAPGLQPDRISPLGLTSAEYAEATRDAFGLSRDRALRAYRMLFRGGSATDLGKAARAATSLELPELGTVHAEPTNEGTTAKFTLAVDRPTKGPLARDERVDKLYTESVIIPMIGSKGNRTYTLCVSSQVGCAMGCGFCETAQMGLIRNLTPEEIVAQWHAATFRSDEPLQETDGRSGAEPVHPGAKRRIKNIVFMGMGEPMDNPEAVIQAIRVLCDHNGAGVPAAAITVSTVGRIDGLERLAKLVMEPGFHKLGVAVSINAPNDTVRNEIMPINRAMPMGDLREALMAFPYRARNKFCFEYVLIPGVNDDRVHACELAEYLRPFAGTPDSPVPRGLLNLIPYNPRRNSPWPAPSEEHVEAFMRWLIEEGVFVKRRRTKGRSQMAACGQLGSAEIRKRTLVPLTNSVEG
ncbi:MAG: 23S rRNA (adenine(2503)-C(2))-methyltransferase RlmN [Planctomycetota bacterium]